MTHWTLCGSGDPIARTFADFHYNRQSVGAKAFVPPGRRIVLVSENCDAVWVTSYPYPQFQKHAWPGSFVNSLFRNEGPTRSSELIIEALARTRWRWPEANSPMITFIHPEKVRSRNPGYCYLKAGFTRVGYTQGGLHVLRLGWEDFPKAEEPMRPNRTPMEFGEAS